MADIPLPSSAIPPLEAAAASPTKTFLHDHLTLNDMILDPIEYIRRRSMLYDVKTAVRLMVQYGCRSVEILSITWSHVMQNDTVLVVGAKRSRSRVIVIPGSTQAKCKIPKDMIKKSIFSCNYRQLEKHMLMHGYAKQPEGHKKRIITHVPRHNLASSVQEIATKMVAGDVLQHRAKSSINYYPPPPPPPPPWTPPEQITKAYCTNPVLFVGYWDGHNFLFTDDNHLPVEEYTIHFMHQWWEPGPKDLHVTIPRTEGTPTGVFIWDYMLKPLWSYYYWPEFTYNGVLYTSDFKIFAMGMW